MQIVRLDSQRIDESTTSAIPGGDIGTGSATVSGRDRNRRVPIPSILGSTLPSRELMRSLLEEYFDAVHWFSLVVYEPTLRARVQSVEDGYAKPSQKPFLILLSVILGMAAWYRSQKSTTELVHLDEDWVRWRSDLLGIAESHLVELMDQSSISSVQACVLLGSYYVYHGRPNLSFALLGATVKTSQAIGLHREIASGSLDIIEERKRVWWTIYTWDRRVVLEHSQPEMPI